MTQKQQQMGVKLFGDSFSEYDMTYEEEREINQELDQELDAEEPTLYQFEKITNPDYEGVTITYSDGTKRTFKM